MSISIENGRIMTLTRNIILLFCVSSIWASRQIDIESNDLNESDYGVQLLSNNDIYLTQYKYINRDVEKVRLQLFYECLCPDCINFDVHQFAPVVKTMSKYLDIHTYPFGNAKIIDDNGNIKIECQHGEAECYGNKLHACAIDNLQHTTALLFNACLMNSTDGRGSDDESADRCGHTINVDSEAIKACAKSSRGMDLLLYYGQESKKEKFKYVPYILINGKEYKGNDLKRDVCAAFTNPPQPCINYNSY